MLNLETESMNWDTFWGYQLLNLPLTLFSLMIVSLIFKHPWMTMYSVAFDWVYAIKLTVSTTAILSLVQLIPMFYLFTVKQSPVLLKGFYLSLFGLVIPVFILSQLMVGI